MSLNAQTIISGIKKYPILIVSSILSIALLCVLYFRSDLIDAQQAELDKYTAQSVRQRTNISNSIQLQDHLDFLIKANAAVRDRSLVAGGLAQNLQYFYRLEAEVGVKYLDLRPGGRPSAGGAQKAPAGKQAVAAKPTYVPLNYNLSVQGDFVQVITFLRRLEQGTYFCRINSAMASAGGSLVTVNLNLDLLGVP